MQPGVLHITDFGELNSKGATLISRAEQADNELASTTALANPDEVWGGAAANAYRTAYSRWQAAEIDMIAQLKAMGSFIQQASAAYESQNNEVLRALGLMAD